MNNLIISPSPHIHSGNSTSSAMYGVLIALIPAFVTSVYYFGVGALVVMAISVFSCVTFEYLIQKYILKVASTIRDGSAMLTGVLLAFNLPSNLPWWIILIGAFASIGIAKMTFGGLGNNIFNPALIGRVFLLVSFPAYMTVWPEPGQLAHYTDVVTSATPLSVMKKAIYTQNPEVLNQIEYSDLMLGNIGGSLGEISAIALVIGLVYLLWKRVITWHIPFSILITVFVVTALLHYASPDKYASPFMHLLSGGLLLGAIFMATDYVTSPMSRKGMIIYGVGIGLLTVIIRCWGAYPEGVSFAILIMNAFTPLINMYVKPLRYGKEGRK